MLCFLILVSVNVLELLMWHSSLTCVEDSDIIESVGWSNSTKWSPASFRNMCCLRQCCFNKLNIIVLQKMSAGIISKEVYTSQPHYVVFLVHAQGLILVCFALCGINKEMVDNVPSLETWINGGGWPTQIHLFRSISKCSFFESCWEIEMNNNYYFWN